MDDKPIAAGLSSFDLIDPEMLFRELGLLEGSTLLDLGCGRGNFSIEASRYIGGEGIVYAVDLWREGIDFLKSRIRENKLSNIEAIVADASRRIPVEDGSIDTCLLATVLHDLVQDKTDESALREIDRILKFDGTLAVLEFKKIDGPPGPPASVRLAPEEVEVMTRRFGLHPVRTVDAGPYIYLSFFTKPDSR